jgi:hypothetical protein
MGIVETILFFGGVILAFVGGIWMLVLAFKESLVWGLCSLLIPFVLLVFALMHWDTCKKAFGIWVAGVLFYVGAIVFFAEEEAIEGQTPTELVE